MRFSFSMIIFMATAYIVAVAATMSGYRTPNIRILDNHNQVRFGCARRGERGGDGLSGCVGGFLIYGLFSSPPSPSVTSLSHLNTVGVADDGGAPPP